MWPLATRTSDRKSTRLNSSHMSRSYAVFCLKKKKGEEAGHGYQHHNERNQRGKCRVRRRRCGSILRKNTRSTHHYHFFFFNDTATTEIYTLSLHDALPI